jgi:hypothetical protein
MMTMIIFPEKVSIEEGVDALDAFMMRLKAGNAAAVDATNNRDNIARDGGGLSSEEQNNLKN